MWLEEVVEDATQIILGERLRPSNDPRTDGNQYVLVRIKVKNGSDTPARFPVYTLNLVGNTNLEYDTGCDYRTIPDNFDISRNIFGGGELSGNICFTVKSSDAGSLVMYYQYGSDYIFMALR